MMIIKIMRILKIKRIIMKIKMKRIKIVKKKMMINLYLKLMKKLILMMRIIQVRKNRE